MRKKPRILIISKGEFSGSKPKVASALRERGCDVVEFTNTLRDLPFKFFYIPFIGINALFRYKARFRQFMNNTYAWYFAFSKFNDSLLRKDREIDVVILFQSYAQNFWKKKRPDVLYAIFTDHTNLLSKKLPDYGYIAPEKSVHPRWNRIEQKILSQQDHIFVLGAHVQQSMVEDYSIDPQKITVVGAGASLDIDIERDGIEKNYRGRQVLFVGFDPERKGLKVVERAFRSVLNDFPDAILNVVGVSGTSSKNMVYHGKLPPETLKSLHYESQIFVLPALREPFGYSFLEAMLAKNVCIGTNIEAIPEVIKQGETGYVIEPNDDKMLAERISGLLASPDLLRKMGEQAYKTVKARWGWDRAVERMIEQIYRGLADRNPEIQWIQEGPLKSKLKWRSDDSRNEILPAGHKKI